MQIYRNISGESGVHAYEIGIDCITIAFRRGGIYLYTTSSTGVQHLRRMQELARAGHGLNSYINQYVGRNYAERLA